MARTAAAYDLDLLQRQYEQSQRLRQPPELRVVTNAQPKKIFVSVRAIFVFLALIAFMAAFLYNKMVLTELTAELESVSARNAELQDDYRRMMVEQEGKISLCSVEDIAAGQLGMAKMEDYQVEYIDLGEDSRVLLAREPSKTFSDRILELYDRVLEYMNL